jgi:uncharacterized delta-60 repeat protein
MEKTSISDRWSFKKLQRQRAKFAIQTVRIIALGGATLISSQTFAMAQAGGLDASFGNGGKVSTPVTGTNSVANALAIQGDGKIVVAGGLGGNQDFGLIRYNLNGSLDTAFGMGGIALANIPNGILSVAVGVDVQSDGKIITGGTVYTLDSSPSGVQVFIGLGLVRFNANGSVDTSFGNGGVVTTQAFNASQCNASAFAVQPDGKILLAGHCITGTGSTATGFSIMARFEIDGSLDSSLGTGGVGILTESPTAIALQSDEKIVIAGGSTVSRYNSNGSIDSSFGIFGSAGSVGTLAAVAVQADGKIVVAGTFSDKLTVTPQGEMVAIRYNTDGTVDDAFGTHGGALTNFFTGASAAAAFALAVQSNGDIVVAGTATSGSGPSEFAIARLTSTGILDSTFGSGGRVTTGFGTNSASIAAIALQTDGKTVAAGNATNIAAGSDAFAVARYTAR